MRLRVSVSISIRNRSYYFLEFSSHFSRSEVESQRLVGCVGILCCLVLRLAGNTFEATFLETTLRGIFSAICRLLADCPFVTVLCSRLVCCGYSPCRPLTIRLLGSTCGGSGGSVTESRGPGVTASAI